MPTFQLLGEYTSDKELARCNIRNFSLCFLQKTSCTNHTVHGHVSKNPAFSDIGGPILGSESFENNKSHRNFRARTRWVAPMIGSGSQSVFLGWAIGGLGKVHELTQPMGAILPLELLGLYIFSRGKIGVRLLFHGSPQK